jgi:hypothetical protein
LFNIVKLFKLLSETHLVDLNYNFDDNVVLFKISIFLSLQYKKIMFVFRIVKETCCNLCIR